MPVRKAIVESEIGLHARPAARFVRAVTETGLPVTISKEGISPVDARSLLEVMTADFGCGCEIELSVSPEALPAGFTEEDAEGALTALGALLEGMGTDQRVSRVPSLAPDQAAVS
ncbi:HPr family phosphocarrier protein [Arthrobacter sp.]|uniref:HPr family phosphocarrier protein n=1 Tax=Arthrobacter sp. TaxID=1667 RepID=UPI002810AB03|nr:HPr family phosphocarrier protein [Arthrobacter sp.]